MRAYTFDAALTEDFAAFRSEIYRGDTGRAAPLAMEIRAHFAPEFAFHRRPGNRHKNFAATVDGEVVGHISAIINRDLKDRDGMPVGAVGFFECVEDYSVAGELLNAATEWLQRENGLRRIWGPIQFDIWHGYRFMTRGFDATPFYGEPYNKPYYPAYFERFGFTARQQWSSIELLAGPALRDVIARGEEQYRQLAEAGYRFEGTEVGCFRAIRKLHAVLTRAFRGLLGYTPIPLFEFQRLLAAKCRDPRLVTVIYDDDDAPAGCAVAYPDAGDGAGARQGMDGFGTDERSRNRRRGGTRVVFHMIGITPEEAAKKRSLGKAVVYHTIKESLSAGYESVIPALMWKSSWIRGHVGKNMGAAQRDYALYELNR